MDLQFCKVTRKGPVTMVTLSRPEVYNALHIDAHFELNKVFDEFCSDPEQWVAIVTGAGDKAFCAGNDLKWQAAGGTRGWDKGGFAVLTARLHCNKTVIAAERWAEQICKNSPMSIRASKQAIDKGMAVSLEQAITEQREYPAVKAMAASQDYIEGPKAFSEKRPPKWLGR